MTLPNNPFVAPSGVPQPNQAPAEGSSLSAPMGTPVMAAPTVASYGAVPVHTGAASSSRSTHGRIGAWMVIVIQSISLVHGFIPYHFDHLDDYVSRFSNPLFWFWRLMGIVVIALAVHYLRKGAVIARYVAACIIVVLFFIVTPVMFVVRDVAWYYAFVPEPGLFEIGSVGVRVILMQVLDWICLIAAILLAIPDFKSVPSPYAMSAPVPAAGTAPAGQVPVPSATPEGFSSETVPEASSAQATNTSGFTAPQ